MPYLKVIECRRLFPHRSCSFVIVSESVVVRLRLDCRLVSNLDSMAGCIVSMEAFSTFIVDGLQIVGVCSGSVAFIGVWRIENLHLSDLIGGCLSN